MSANSKAGILAVSGAFAGLSIIFVGSRFYARRLQKLPLMADDWIMIPGLLAYLGAAIGIFIAVHKKTLGYSSFDFTLEEMLAVNKVEQQLDLAISILQSCSLGFTKLSALFFYRRVFCTGQALKTMAWFNITTLVFIVIVSCWLVIYQFLGGFQCHGHFSALWDGTYAKYCTISFHYLYSLAISDFLLDICILALPIPIILRLHMTPSRKLSIIGLFLLAFVGLGASIARMVEYIQIETGGDPALFTDEERTETRTLWYSMLEAGISLIAVNLPSLWLFFTSLLPEKIVASVRSMISLRSLNSQRSQHGVRLDDAGISATHLDHKPEASSSVDSGRPDLPSDFSELRQHREMDWQKLSGNKGGSQKVEAIAMQNTHNGEQRERAWLPQGQIHIQDNVEVSREEHQKAENALC